MLVVHETNMRPGESTVELTPLGKIVGTLSKFLSKEAEGLWVNRSQDVRIKRIPIGASQNWGKLERRLLANEMYQRVQQFKLRGDGSQCEGSEGRDNLITRLVENEPRQQESSEVNQVSSI
ncbi:hypothetical protein J1N35_038455 [Gossypium stocksii]|uniref:Uncharacterized protein n=1 Tax=Gossypium stocksii TaxID=47602 RepID=A0A9D3ZLW1_9ROSI|nr:hypothetical protein J1N35_038455 [Gossypium stocksii]